MRMPMLIPLLQLTPPNRHRASFPAANGTASAVSTSTFSISGSTSTSTASTMLTTRTGALIRCTPAQFLAAYWLCMKIVRGLESEREWLHDHTRKRKRR